MTFKVVTSILNFYIPTVIITVLYVRIFIAIKQRSKVRVKVQFQEPQLCDLFYPKDIVRFGAYTASGVTSTKAKKTENTPVKKAVGNGREGLQEKLEKKPSEEISAQREIGGQGEMNKNEKKIEFHRLAVVAFPMEQGKCQKTAATAASTKAISSHADTNNRIYQRNLGKKDEEIFSFWTYKKLLTYFVIKAAFAYRPRLALYFVATILIFRG